MKLICAFLLLPLCDSIAVASSVESALPCGGAMSPNEAYERAAAVFAGKVLAIETRYAPARKLGEQTPYQEVRLEVERSWKLVDRQEVTVITQNIYEKTCGNFKQAETYLVYADSLNDTLYVSSGSRTNRLADAAEDLKALGEARLKIETGEFRTHTVMTYGILVSAVLMLLLGIFLYRLLKKPIRV
jgi:hypothetical protein